MEKIAGIKLSLQQGIEIKEDLQPNLSSHTLSQILGVDDARLLRCSIDARKKHDVHFVATAGIIGSNRASADTDTPQAIVPLEKRPLPHNANRTGTDRRPVICGMGPAGLFAALELAEAGLCPIVIERGAPVEERREDVKRFRITRILDTSSNVQFGEGGAGTFSDGKLTCGKNSPLTTHVLQTFVAAGAPLDILWQAKPHIGTDVLGSVVRGIRTRIQACGGEVHFRTQLSNIQTHDGNLESIILRNPQGEIETPCSTLVLATGHSARDTLEMLHEAGLRMEPKAFSMGVRIEHQQESIDRAQYGRTASHPALGAADYKLNVHLNNGRGVYTFCMCPGGEVVAASSEEGMLCVNGMSEHARAGRNANSALLCSIIPDDFRRFGGDAHNPLSGIEFQRHWERAAFIAGGSNWCAPAQTVGSFLGNESAGRTKGLVEPTYPLGINETDLRGCLPDFVASSLAEALPLLERKLQGFSDANAMMTGIEARSSSPVRIVRNRESLESETTAGIFPCGEGAGYAGGIMSAAIDGITVARKIIDKTGISTAQRY